MIRKRLNLKAVINRRNNHKTFTVAITYVGIRNDLLTAESVDAAADGQPLLVFNFAGLGGLFRLYVSTNSDQKKISTFKVTSSMHEVVNKVDLKNPKIVREWSEAKDMVCAQIENY